MKEVLKFEDAEKGKRKKCSKDPVDNGKASTQAKAIQEILEEWEPFDIVEFLSLDATVTNTGWLNGVCIQLEKYRGKVMGWLE